MAVARSTRPALSLAAALALLATSACTGAPPVVDDGKPGAPASVDPDVGPDDEGLVAVFDVATQTLPLPTDLWRAGGQVNLPPIATRSPAEAQLLAHVDGADGWPRQSAVFIPLTGALSEDTDDGDVRLFDLGRQQAIDVEVELEPLGIRLVPTEALLPGATYVYALLRSATGADGAPLEVTASFADVLSTEPLEDRAAEARRQLFAPWLAALGQRGVARSELAMVGAFTTTTAPAPRFAPRLAEHTVPSAFLRDEEGAIALPEGTVDPLLAARLAEYDGFSTTAPVRFRAPVALDPDGPLGPGAMELFLIDDDDVLAAPFNAVDPVYIDSDTYGLVPQVALPASTSFALVVHRPITSDEVPLAPDLGGQALVLDVPLLDGNGETAVRFLPRVDARALEPHRLRLAPVRDALRSAPGGLDDVLQLRPFRTLDARRLSVERRQRLYDDDVPTTPGNVVEATPFERGLWLVLPHVDTIISGTVPTLDWLDPVTRADREDGPEVGDTHFVLTLPADVPDGQAVPVVLFGHGLKTTRELVYVVADVLASAGFASFAVDLPYHGERSACLSDNNCPGDSRCSIYGQCVDEAGDVVEIGAIESPFWPDGPRIPPTTGVAYIDFHDLMASRDHVLQSLVDLSQAVRVIRDVDWTTYGPRALDGDDVVYLGISLGGILGASLAGMEEHISTWALNVPGAGFVELFQDSAALGPQLDDYLDEVGVARGTPAFAGFESDAKWAIDPVDPLNLAPRPGDDVRMLIQMAVGDAVVPNSATYLLSAATGVEISIYEPAVLGHGFLADPTQLESGAAREELLDFYAAR